MTMDSTITYDVLYELLRKEKYSTEIQKVDASFFKDVIRYLDEKESIIESQKSKESIFSNDVQKTEKQVENIKRIIQDLYERRERKIVEVALFSARNSKKEPEIVSAMLPEEKLLFKRLTDNLKISKESILSNLLEGKPPEEIYKKKIENNNTLIRFTSSVPKFVGIDNFTYGPFEKEDISSLPEEISSILINKKRAERLEI